MIMITTSRDILDELEDQGWRPNHPCYIYVVGEGDLGQCLSPHDVLHTLIGIGIALLLLKLGGQLISRLYRCRSPLFLTTSSLSLPVRIRI